MPEKVYSSYGQLIIETSDLNTLKSLVPKIDAVLQPQHDIEYKIKLLQVGPTPIAGIEARFYGPDPAVLRRLGAQAMAVMEAEPGAIGVRHTWREKVDIVRPVLDEAAARRSGISKQSVDEAMLVNFSGRQIGLYRDGSHLLPIGCPCSR